MTPNDVPPRELSPQELRKVYDRIRREFTAEKLMEYIEDDAPKVPADVVMAGFEAILAGGEVPPGESP